MVRSWGSAPKVPCRGRLNRRMHLREAATAFTAPVAAVGAAPRRGTGQRRGGRPSTSARQLPAHGPTGGVWRQRRRGGAGHRALPAVGARPCDEAGFVSRLRRHHILLLRRGGRASGGSCTSQPCGRTQATDLPGAQRANRGLTMTSAIVTYLHRRKSREAKAQSAASKAASGTWGATAATGERKSEDNANKAAAGYRQPNRDKADDLAPARRPCVAPTGDVCPAELFGRWLLRGRNMGQTGHIRDRLLLGPVRRWRNCRGITSLNTSRNSSSVRSAS